MANSGAAAPAITIAQVPSSLHILEGLSSTVQRLSGVPRAVSTAHHGAQPQQASASLKSLFAPVLVGVRDWSALSEALSHLEMQLKHDQQHAAQMAAQSAQRQARVQTLESQLQAMHQQLAQAQGAAYKTIATHHTTLEVCPFQLSCWR